MKITKNSHCDGLHNLPDKHKKEIEQAISVCDVEPGKAAATKIRKKILSSLVQNGWSSEVSLARDSDITITSAKDGIGLCLQTGNMSRMYADLVKLQKMFLDGGIKVGVMIVPTAAAAKLLGSNIVNAERLMRELDIFRKVLHMPLVIFAFE